MKLRQIETFFWVVKLGSFSAAAERLHATQSTISMRIQELEKGFGVELFDRSQRSARLTPKGRELVEYAERLLELAAQMEQRLCAPESIAGYVRLGVAEVVSVTWLPKLIEVLYHTYPRIRLEIEEGLTLDLMDRLHNGALDLALVPGRKPVPDVVAHSLGSVEFAWMASPSLNLGGRSLGPSDLARWPIISLKRDSYHYAFIEDWFRCDHARSHYVGTCKSTAVAGSLTAAGISVSFLPVRCFSEELRHGKLEVLCTHPALPPVEFIAALSIDEFHPLAHRIAELAMEVSDFDKPLAAAAKTDA